MNAVAKPPVTTPSPFCSLGRRAIGGNAYRVTFVVKGDTAVEVQKSVVKELARRHWDVTLDDRGLISIYGFKPADGPTEPITGLTITVYANHPIDPPPVPGVIRPEGIKVRKLIQMYPGPGIGEKP
jgi:hypothetical protein